jgi:hypothetical protein
VCGRPRRADYLGVIDLPDTIVPVFAVSIVSALILLALQVPFVRRQRERGFPINYRFVFLAGFSAAILVLAVTLFSTAYVSTVGMLPILSATAVVMLLLISIRTDFSIHKIPTESAWLPFLVGAPSFLFVLLAGYYSLNITTLTSLVVLAIFPIVAFLSLLLAGGGAADVRITLSGFFATFWWINPTTLIYGLGVYLIFLLIGRYKFPKYVEGRKKPLTPAGPAYVSIFAVTALATLAGI